VHRTRTLTSTTRSAVVTARPETAWGVVASGEQMPQWYVDAAPYAVRGAVDRLVGGAGRRWPPPGRRFLLPGDQAGFWRVHEVSHEHRRLVLEAAVRAPGRVRVTTEVAPASGGTRLTQTTSFAPRGLRGRAYLLADLPARAAVAELVMLHLLTVLRRVTTDRPPVP